MAKNENTQNSPSFLAVAFFRGHNSTFCILEMQMRKKLYIFKHFCKKQKVIFLPISIFLRVIPIKFETLKPPSTYGLGKKCTQKKF